MLRVETPQFQVKQLSSTSETHVGPEKTIDFTTENALKVPEDARLSENVTISKIPVTITQKLAFEEGSSQLTKVALKSLDGVLSVLNGCESKICIEASQSHSEASGINHARASAVKSFSLAKVFTQQDCARMSLRSRVRLAARFRERVEEVPSVSQPNTLNFI